MHRTVLPCPALCLKSDPSCLLHHIVTLPLKKNTDTRFVQRFVIREYDAASASNLQIATSGPIPTKDTCIRSGMMGASGRAAGGRFDSSRNSVVASQLQESSRSSRLESSSCVDASVSERQHEIEAASSSSNYDTLHEMGIQVPVARRKKSLFDYGMNQIREFSFYYDEHSFKGTVHPCTGSSRVLWEVLTYLKVWRFDHSEIVAVSRFHGSYW